MTNIASAPTAPDTKPDTDKPEAPTLPPRPIIIPEPTRRDREDENPGQPPVGPCKI